jgi:2'-5' RNA ligase
MKFLGERSADFVEALRHDLDRLVPGSHDCLDLSLEGVGAFPSVDRPRVLWVGIRPNPAATRLYHTVEDACAALGVPREERAFHPHVTIGRVRPAARVAGLPALSAGVSVVARDRVCRLDVMESVLGPRGARYEAVARIALNERTEVG